MKFSVSFFFVEAWIFSFIIPNIYTYIHKGERAKTKKRRSMGSEKRVTIGVLALQGAFIEHVYHLQRCAREYLNEYGLDALEVITVRTVSELERCDALVIPGGESTSISLIAQRTGLHEHLVRFVHDPTKAIWGTCAGLIFISQQVVNGSEHVSPLGLLKVSVKRNAFGRQTHSFTKECDFSGFIPGCTDFPATFIRAPVIDKILDPEEVEILYSLPSTTPDVPDLIVAVRQGDRVLGTSFHPELASTDIRFHDWFIKRFVLPLTSH